MLMEDYQERIIQQKILVHIYILIYYLNYLYKEIDILFNFLNANNIKLNVGTVFFGGGSPTILNREDLKSLVDKLKGLKENVIVGRLIPAGTGHTKIRWQKIAEEKDELLSESSSSKTSDKQLPAN